MAGGNNVIQELKPYPAYKDLIVARLEKRTEWMLGKIFGDESK